MPLILLPCLALASCSVPEVRLKPENLPYVALNFGLDQVEKLADPPSRGFRKINKEILRIGPITVHSGFKVSVNSEDEDDDVPSGVPDDEDGFRTSSRFKLRRNMVYFEVRIRW